MQDHELALKAQETLFQHAYVPTFIRKCASAGVTFNSEAELVAALKSAHVLKQREAEAVQTNSLHKLAAQVLGVDIDAESTDEIVKIASDLQLTDELVAAAEYAGALQTAAN